MYKILFLLVAFGLPLFLEAQELRPTETLLVKGKVKAERSFTLNEIKKFKAVALTDVNTSCSPKKKELAKTAKAILVKDLLDSVRFQYESPKMLHRFYFRFEGSDGYTVVFSFNEIYNTDTGNNLYVVTQLNDQDISNMENRILLLCTSDLKQGGRNIKGLERIVVCMAE